MGRIFLWAGQGHTIEGVLDTEIMARLHHQSAVELRAQGLTVFEVPTGLRLPAAIAWINARTQPSDVALALETAAFPSAKVRGTSIFYIANNTERRTQVAQLLHSLLQRVPSLVNRGCNPIRQPPLAVWLSRASSPFRRWS